MLGLLGRGIIRVHTSLEARHFVPDPVGEHLRELPDGRFARFREVKKDRRLVKDKVVTDDFVEDIVDGLVAQSWTCDYTFHHSGTGDAAEDPTDAALGQEVEDARVVGTHVETSSKVYKSVATITYTGTHAITEHGLFNGAGEGGPPVTGGILMDRTKFSVINVVSGNQIEFTFEITFASGS